MAFTTKLDTEVITVGVSSNVIVYTESTATIELNNVVAYHTYIKPDGTATTHTQLYVTGAPAPIIVKNTYAAIDALINP